MSSTASAKSSRPQPEVVVYTATGCSLCERATEVVREVCGERFKLVSIDGVPELERLYRTSIPVVEIDGARAFTYFVEPDALRSHLQA